MELLNHINNKLKEYSVMELFNNKIVIRIKNIDDLVELINEANKHDTIYTFNPVKIWNEYVKDIKKGYDGEIAVEIKDFQTKNYKYNLDFGWVGFYNILYQEEYTVVDYFRGIICDWSIN